MNKKLAELSEEKRRQVSGGVIRNDLGGRHRDNSPEQTPGQELAQQNRGHESHEEPLVCYHDKRHDTEN